MKTIICACVIILTTLFGAATALADNATAAEPFSVVSQDGTVVFHFNPHHSPDLPTTGLYQNFYPHESVYLIQHPRGWQVFEDGFFFTASMREFAVVPRYPIEYGIEFFAYGERVSGYTVYDLVENHEFLFNIDGFYVWWDSLDFDSGESQLTITTTDGLRYIFDIAGGYAVYMSASGSLGFFVLFGAAILLVFAARKYFAVRKAAQDQQHIGIYGQDRH